MYAYAVFSWLYVTFPIYLVAVEAIIQEKPGNK